MLLPCINKGENDINRSFDLGTTLNLGQFHLKILN